MKRFFGILLCLAMIVSVFACMSVSASADGKTLNLALKGDIESLDVHLTTADYEVPLNVYDRLFEISINPETNSAELNNSLVEDYSVSEDALTYSFTLKSGILFSDGSPLTAADVAYSLTRMVALENSEQEYLFECVEGYEEFSASGNYHDTYMTGIEVQDDTHFTMKLSKPYAGFLNVLASPACCIYNQAACEAGGDNFGQDYTCAIGTGPYVISAWNHDAEIVLTANENYWGEAPDFTEAIIHIIPSADTQSMMFQAGELDVLDCDYIDSMVVASIYKTMYADKMVASTRLGSSYMALNASNEALSDVVARKAVQMCIDREAIIATILNGDAVTYDGIYPQGLVGYTEDNQGWLTYDVAAAQAMLEEAGYTKDADGYYFGFTIQNDEDNSDSRKLAIQAIAEQLKSAGINCEIKNNDHASWLAMRKAGEMDSYVSTWTADYNDPDNFIATFWGGVSSTTGRSLCYANEDIMARVSAAPAIIDEAERLAEYAELEKIIVAEDASWVPLYVQTHLFVISENVASFVPHWAGYSDFQFAYAKAA